jgi:hypothetical protein
MSSAQLRTRTRAKAQRHKCRHLVGGGHDLVHQKGRGDPRAPFFLHSFRKHERAWVWLSAAWAGPSGAGREGLTAPLALPSEHDGGQLGELDQVPDMFASCIRFDGRESGDRGVRAGCYRSGVGAGRVVWWCGSAAVRGRVRLRLLGVWWFGAARRYLRSVDCVPCLRSLMLPRRGLLSPLTAAPWHSARPLRALCFHTDHHT